MDPGRFVHDRAISLIRRRVFSAILSSFPHKPSDNAEASKNRIVSHSLPKIIMADLDCLPGYSPSPRSVIDSIRFDLMIE